MVEGLGEFTPGFELLRRHQEAVSGTRPDLELAELVLEDHLAERLGRLHAAVPGEVSVLVEDGLAVLRHRVGEEVEQRELHAQACSVELPLEQDVPGGLLVLQVINQEIVETQFLGSHRWFLASQCALLIGNRFWPSVALARGVKPKACVSIGAG